MRFARSAKVVAGIALLVVILFGRKALRFWSEWLWFQSLGYESVFTTQLTTKIALGVLVGAVFFALVYGNMALARKLSPGALRPMGSNVIYLRAHPYLERYLYAVMGVAVLAAALVVGRTGADQWASVLRFLHAQPFGATEPVFHKDVGFYIFRWPFLRWAYNQLTLALLLSLAGSAALYLASSALRVTNGRLYLAPAARAHGAMLFALLFFAKAWGYVLQSYGVLFSTRAVAYGAGYTDLHATLPALRILIALALLGGVLLLFCVRLNAIKLLLYTVGGMIVVSLLAGSAFPTIVQKYMVEPNELDRERPYLERTIRFTRRAYDLDRTDARPYEAAPTLTPADLEANAVTLHSIRLWDHRPLLATYRQIQEIRTYYEFLDVDIDRYYVGGEYRQVTVSAREMSYDKNNPTAQTWVNQHLKFTHGYGVCMSPVNEVAGEGLPKFFVKDIPPVSEVGPSLQIRRPELYYGEGDAEYCLVKTKEKEFDYPRGADNVTTDYKGKGGVWIGSFARRLAYSVRFGDMKLLFTRSLTKDSRILLRRRIRSRVEALAPFLLYDRDPYIVVADGRLWWIIDAYTVATQFPYSEPFLRGGENYIRNSIKVVVDPLNGTTTFYVVDPKDPVLKVYRRIFPKLFTNFEKMPLAIRPHLRYPVDLFAIQAEKYAVYHMTNPETFYNKEDLWELPHEVYEGEGGSQSGSQPMPPYYVVMKLPAEHREEFVLMIPFVPAHKDNMIAWMCARCDPGVRGQLVVFNFPKDKLIYGPMQIEARIDQNTSISRQLTLWSQKGSRVIRGNLLVIPLGDSLIYVEPLYLQAEIGQMPELKRVLVAFHEEIVMAPTLESALNRLFGQETAGGGGTTLGPGAVAVSPEWRALIDSANTLLNAAQQHAGTDWSAYGRDIDQLTKRLRKLQELAGPKPSPNREAGK